MGEVTYRRFPPRLRVTSLDGIEAPPESVALLLLRAKAEAGEATGGPARDRVTFLEQNLSELVFDLRCRNGHSTLRTMPQLAQAVNRAGGEWAQLRS